MALQIFGLPSCKDTQKLQRWLKERSIEFHNLDISKKSPSPGELDSLARACGGYENLLDTMGQRYKKKGLSHMVFDAKEVLLEDPLLLKTPFLRAGSKAIQGFDPKAIESFIKDNT